MDRKHATSAPAHNRDASKTPNLPKPPAKAATISAAAVFKKQKPNDPELRSSSRTPLRATAKRTARKSQVEEVHPLALAFKGSSKEYRRHLYSTAVTKINKDLDAFLGKLYESNLQVTSCDLANHDSYASPLKLTAPAKYQREVQKLYTPLSNHRYLLQRTNSLGKVERVQMTIHDRLQSFEETMAAETVEIKNLQTQWEGIVAEIFQFGVACLGEENIAALLSIGELEANQVESTLFVPEQGASPHKGKGKRKHVSFAGPDMAKLFPSFLFRAPGQQRKAIPASPELPTDEVEVLEQVIKVLGKQHVADLQQLEREYVAWWKKKQKQLAYSFAED